MKGESLEYLINRDVIPSQIVSPASDAANPRTHAMLCFARDQIVSINSLIIFVSTVEFVTNKSLS